MQQYEQAHHNNNTVSQPTQKDVGLLSSVNTLKALMENHTQKLDDLEFKLLEKEEQLITLRQEMNIIKAQNEEKDLEISRLNEEINVARKAMTELIEKLQSPFQK